MNIHESSFIGAFLQMLPTPGFEEQTRAQVGQGLLQILIRFVENDPLPGNFATFLYRATVFVTVKSMGERKNILPCGAPGGNIFFNQ
jgi:hypothetical protein